MTLVKREKRFLKTDIYPVITPEFCKERSPIRILESCLKGGAKIVLLRDKKDPEKYAADFRKITNRYNALLIINDSLEIALKHNADGIHLGINDLPINEARRLAPELLIGASIHNLQEALSAQDNGASYINIGPIFLTKTKPGVKRFLGVEAIREISPHIKIPFTVMGGINKENILQVLDIGARHIAMVTAITEAEDVEKTAQEFIRLCSP